ncbi:acyltransferase [Albimonas sp. CAU 1670]|uniref:acyltransferase family protein n=1 Tax=Albimonas sp. CAU 1670 TaxID=3032599 RepID=UPI0023DB836E|nr:acyltransferase [Albimonas sp. CAU 1670]MDF2231954.1 acyltransferase [Albimonas sp. CAU 1670]
MAAERNLDVDRLRVVLALLVIGIHAYPLTEIWPAGAHLFREGVTRIAVPTFFVLSGVFLHAAAARPDGGRRWLRRLGAIYAAWSVLYATWWIFDLAPDAGGLATGLARLALGWWHLWYLAAAAQAGVALLLLSRRLSPRALGLLAAALLLAGWALQYAVITAPELPGGTFLVFGVETTHEAQLWIYRNALFAGLPFMAAGWILAEVDLPRRAGGPALGAVLALGFAAVLAEALLTPIPPDRPLDLLLGLPAVSVALTALVLRSPRTTPTAWLADYATAVYLIHAGILLQLRLFADLSPTGEFLATVALSLALAGPAVRLCRRTGMPI